MNYILRDVLYCINIKHGSRTLTFFITNLKIVLLCHYKRKSEVTCELSTHSLFCSYVTYRFLICSTISFGIIDETKISGTIECVILTSTFIIIFMKNLSPVNLLSARFCSRFTANIVLCLTKFHTRHII